MGFARTAFMVLLMSALATVTYFFVLHVLHLDYPQAVSAACSTTPLVPFAMYNRSKDKRERGLMIGQVVTLLVTAVISALVPYVTTIDAWLFPAWYVLGLLGVGTIIRLTMRLEANGVRMTDEELEHRKSMRCHYMALEEDIEAELEACIPDEERFLRKARILRYLRKTRKLVEEEILEANTRATLRPPPAIGSDPVPSSPPSRPANGARKRPL